MVPFDDDAVDAVRKTLLTCDGVMAWVNPIQDGVNRARLDPLLSEVSAAGIWVTAHPDVILKLGTKEVLFQTRDLGWGSDTALYRTFEEFELRFAKRLAARGRLVLKQGRGNGGNGVWKVELLENLNTDVGPDTIVRVQDAREKDGSSEQVILSSFMQRCQEYFTWSGCLVDQVYQERLAEGMIRCYFTHDRVVGFCHQWPKGLLDIDPNGLSHSSPAPTMMEGPDVPRYQALRRLVESEWVPEMMEVLGIESTSLPVVWDADFLYGPKTAAGDDSYVLCEINVSAVWPFPPMASDTIANTALACTIAAMVDRHGGAIIT